MKIPNEIPISIISNDIKKGIRCSTSLCPTAKATRRALRISASWPYNITEGRYVFVYTDTVIVKDAVSGVKNFNIPDELKTFIKNYDKGNDVRPVSCTLKAK